MDLNIDNYDLNDILKLFHIPIAFNADHLKSAKKTVLKMHPDKSNLDKEYFLFFTKAYRIIYQIYTMRHESAQGYGHVQEYSELIAPEGCSADRLHGENGNNVQEATAQSEKLSRMTPSDFNTWFNTTFEKYVPRNSEDDAGYETWFRGNDSEEAEEEGNGEEEEEEEEKEAGANTGSGPGSGSWNSAQVRNLERHRKRIRDRLALVAATTIESAPPPSSATSVQYEDLKRAHTETLIPVTAADYNNVRQFKTVHELQMFRSSAAANIAPPSKADATAQLERERIASAEQATHRAYLMAKQDEAARDMNRKVMREFQTLKY
jgi:hypothetical protein